MTCGTGRHGWIDQSERCGGRGLEKTLVVWGKRGHYEEEEELDTSFEKGDVNKPSKPASTFPQ